MMDAADVIGSLIPNPDDYPEPFHLRVGDVSVTVHCPLPLRAALVRYFADALSSTPGTITVHILPNQSLDSEPDWTAWRREPGKPGLKDAICDLSGARLVRKVRSGVTFFQSPAVAIAFGPLAQNVSTVINFINTQILSEHLRNGWQLCHAAALAGSRGALAMAGLSGGGKSTSALRMMDINSARYVTNDRLLVRAGEPPQALGIPKKPRINPGTILGNERLHRLLDANRIAELRTMPRDELWALEEKHDVDIASVYGPNRTRYETPLAEFWVLNWSHGSDRATQVSEVDLPHRLDLLGAIMKSAGPFHQHPDGRFEPNGNSPTPGPYLEALRDVKICEVSGRIDFDRIAALGRRVLDD